jgi:CRISPR-associated endonuclease/helicase Cas3
LFGSGVAQSTSFSEVFQTITGKHPYHYQCMLAENPWPDALKVPTGLGKTAAVALAWMYKHLQGDTATPRRLVWCLPMRTLVEQTAASLSCWLAKLEASPLAAQSLLPKQPYVLMGGDVDDNWFLRPEDPAVLIGTQDMLLSRALMRGYGVSRARWPVEFALLHNDALWVFDEVQLMAAGTPTSAQLEAFRREIGSWAGCRSLWMSATLEQDWLKTVDFEQQAAKPFILELTDADREHTAVQQRLAAPKMLARATTTVTLEKLDQNAKALAEEVLGAHRPGKTTLIIVNRVGRAQALYKALKENKALKEKDAPGLLLVHSRFRPAERRRINQQLAEQPGAGGRIIVATQAIEAGVDITSAVMFTELAPWSSLVQRFGRLNRYGEETEAKAFWIDIPSDDNKSKKLAMLYTPEELAAAHCNLQKLKDVSAKSLEEFAHGSQGLWQVLRRKDLYQLFDTDQDLTGFDVDVSPYVRGADDTDVRVFWRSIADPKAGPQGDEARQPHRDELCAVPIVQARSWLENHKSEAFVWDWVDKGWTKFEHLWPGTVVLVGAKVGGYDSMCGFDLESTRPVAPVEVTDAAAAELDRFGDDPDTRKRQIVELPEHLLRVRDEAERLCTALRVQAAEAEAVVTAALWHDLGKGHDVFKARCGLAPDAAPLAKTPDYNWRLKCPPNRRYFRHELASALAWLQHGPQSDIHDLVAYLIAAHHGKVRMGLRAMPDELGPDDGAKRFARGVWDGDALPVFSVDGLSIPDTALALDVMELGGGATGRSWATRTQELLERYGPFRLAFLEALVRIADWRASDKEQMGAHDLGDGDG